MPGRLTIKRCIVFLHDLGWVALALALAYWLRFNLGEVPPAARAAFWRTLALALPLHALAFWTFGCYRGVWRFASLPDLLRLAKAVAVGAVATGAVLFLYSRFAGVPRTVMALYPLLLFVGTAASRVGYRLWRTHRLRLDRAERRPALVVGHGSQAEVVLRAAEQGPYLPVGVVDPDGRHVGGELRGVRVLGGLERLPALLDTLGVEALLVAGGALSAADLDAVLRTAAARGLVCRILPAPLGGGRAAGAPQLRPLRIEDLLGRGAVHLDDPALGEALAGRCVAVTGGGGSIGSELCRQLLRHRPARLLVVDHSEYNLYRLEQDLAAGPVLRTVLLDVCDGPALARLFAEQRPQWVFHAAAYKHVPIVERNPVAGVRNNVFGTVRAAEAARAAGAERFVLVSTDKAVNPANVLGASKRVAELYCRAAEGPTRFVTVRFGNVLGSAGSVVPLFERQIAAGGPVTVTHPDIRRYFMTPDEAAALILQAALRGAGGEIFVLDMGEAVPIRRLAENMIRLHGLEPGRDIEIVYTGLRPGEKLDEELFYADEAPVGTGHPKLLLAQAPPLDAAAFARSLAELERAVAAGDAAAVLGLLHRLVPEYRAPRPAARVVPLPRRAGAER
ncbi:MAG: multidrug MFS transporter [Gammaproteobacteria bacterium]|nr:MAG: multidrug MFS transporter [Gammaproteobacteria bacterium]